MPASVAPATLAAATARPRSARTVDIALRDGSTLRLRPVVSADEPELRRFLATLDERDRALRFFTAAADLDRAAHLCACVERGDGWGIVALAPARSGEPERVVGHGCALRVAPGADSAEVAFVVAAELRGEGVATAMLAHLAELARGGGARRLTAVVKAENAAMIEVFRESGLEVEVRAAAGELELSMPAEVGPGARERYDRRDAEAAVAAVGHVLRPASVAVVGASAREGSIGGAVVRNLLDGGYGGRLHVVNRRGGTIAGLPAARSLTELEEPVELVVVAVPAAGVAEVARDAAATGVKALVVLSDGFGEAGEEGRERQRELLEICRRAGMRLVGPNCLGVLDTDPAVRLDASFAPTQPPAGRVAFLSQSGALGIAVIDTARELGIGLSSFVSVGDKADLSGNDFLSFWEQDAATDVVLLYLESFGNPRRFSRVARRVARSKPIVAVKGGRSSAGAAAAGSHTGALLAGSDATVQALFRQAGVIATDTLGELFDVAALLATQPAPRGPRVGIVTNGGGLGILCADACAAAGLDVVALPAPVRTRLAAALRPGAAVRNPVDLLAAASPAEFEQAISLVGASGAVDAVIALYVPPMVSDPAEIASAIVAGAGAAGVPVAAVMTMADAPRDPFADRLPVFRFPEEAARAVARAAAHGGWLAEAADDPEPALDVDGDRAAAAIAHALAGDDGWLAPELVAELLDAYGIARPAQRIVASARAAGTAARELGGAVALKAIADGLVHRTDAGAVEIGLASPTAVERAASAMRKRLTAAGATVRGFLVQAMAEPGVELLTGVVADPVFGPVVACAAGGTRAELEADSAVRLTPLGPGQAAAMMRELRCFPLLDGFRGAPRCDVPAVERLLQRLAALADAHPEIAEIECNPLVVTPSGALAVDARVRVAPAPERLPEPALRQP
ncbi:GNAT family N-acetyltransferase [Conexibacter sp. JD483]|uniref:bifunctional acetate--CoA ligase family protein/GNAT family N-acetyltransferase n=1 Tax=unclassified Conexibacter TaxID=2627773 RepID=UPI0027245ED6|nr:MULTISPECIES: bifunctional GNAT family N-acetyltransferase/acetate--CoA ligase family protein [unclassified Conexibacter]MDO8188526.1 GNAT family N-acetyltransferase [Conexibacter sp. CPCC 205706]MDO8200130.1 GNAT family N-acetyltransferase [Conexibacter sp. CPCC 205762]MDR9372872.1 GNAT family N-acetyltransferase [Conexibacter sp. JD483]